MDSGSCYKPALPLFSRFSASISLCSFSSVSLCCCCKKITSFSSEAILVRSEFMARGNVRPLTVLSRWGALVEQSLGNSRGYRVLSKVPTRDQFGRFRRGGRLLVDIFYYLTSVFIFNTLGGLTLPQYRPFKGTKRISSLTNG